MIDYVKIWTCFVANRHLVRILKIQVDFYEAHLFFWVYPTKAIDIFFIRIK